MREGGESMRETQRNAGIAPRKKQQRVVEELEAQKKPSTWRPAVVTEALKIHGVRLGHSRSGKRRLDKWDPPSTPLAG